MMLVLSGLSSLPPSLPSSLLPPPTSSQWYIIATSDCILKQTNRNSLMSSGTGVAEFEICLQTCFWRLVKRVSQNGEQESREREQEDIWSSGNHWLRASSWVQPVSAPPRRPEDVWTKHMLVVAHCWDLVLVTAQLVKNPPAMQETPVRFLGWEDPLEKGKATHSTILELPLWFSW